MSPVRPVFLLSLPRSGSTLLQRMLGRHGDVATLSEPWLLLPHVYARRLRGARAEYRHVQAVRALDDFLGAIPDGEAAYREAVRSLALDLYGRAAGDAPYFLDKTPRYSLIAAEIAGIFPDARFLVLWRNPLAVAASMIETWGDGRWNLHRYRVDLHTGVDRLIELAARDDPRVHALRYEDLVTDPHAALKGVCRHLDLPFDDALVEEFTEVRLDGFMGDPTGTARYDRVTRDPLTRWTTVLSNPLRRAWARRYLRVLGPERLARMGYQADTLEGELASAPVSLRRLPSDALRMALSPLRHRFDRLATDERLGRWADDRPDLQ